MHNENEINETENLKRSRHELTLQCATDIIFKAGFTPESLLAMSSMYKNMFVDVYLLPILISEEKTDAEIDGAYHVVDFMIPPKNKDSE